MPAKTRVSDLAWSGGAPLFSPARHVGKPQMANFDASLAACAEVLSSGTLTNQGPKVAAFEAALSAYLAVEHVIVTCNGTLALLLLLRALELSGEVIVPSFTFPATVQVLSWLGLSPVFCEIDPLTHSLDPAAVAAALGPETSAILGVHLWGQPCAIEALQLIADRHGIPLIFDAAHALGCAHRGQRIGGFGRAEMLSFHATKFVHSLEGGAIVTASAELAQRLRRLRNFGYQQGVVHEAGLNAKMNELCAAIGLANLAGVDGLIETNHSRYLRYAEGLAGIPGLKLYPLKGEQNYQYVVLEIGPEYGLSRDRLRDILMAEGILARAYFDPPCHLQPPFAATRTQLPITESLAKRVLVLPTGQQMSSADIEALCALLGFCQNQAPTLSQSQA